MGDRSRYGRETNAILDALARLTHPIYQEVERHGAWDFHRYGRDHYRIFPYDNNIAMTGADVLTQLSIPFDHEWLRILFYHTTAAAAAASFDPLNIDLQRPANTIPGMGDFEETLFSEDQIIASRIQEVFGREFTYFRGVWNLILNSTATDLIYPIFHIRRLPD